MVNIRCAEGVGKRIVPFRHRHEERPAPSSGTGRYSYLEGSTGLILWPGDLDFWEQREEYERRRLEEARRRARLDAEW